MTFPIDPLDVVVELALGADLTAAPSTWVWTATPGVDQPGRVLAADGLITTTRGGRDGAIQAPPSTCTLTVDNTDGRWVPTNPTGVWYGQIRLGTPIRVRTNESTSSVRFTGFLSSLPPRWDPSNSSEYHRPMSVTASGFLTLQRGQTPLRSPLVRAIAGSTPRPVAYWPGEDNSGATSLAEYFGGQPMQLVGQVHTLASDGPPGSSPLVEFTTVAGAVGRLSAYDPSGSWTVAWVMKMPAAPTAETLLLRWNTTGTYPVWRVVLTPGSPDTLSLQAYDTAGVQQINQTMNFAVGANSEPYDQWLLLSAEITQTATGVDYVLNLFDDNGIGGNSTSTGSAAISAGAISEVRVHANSKFDGTIEGHWVVWDGPVSVFLDTGLFFALTAWVGGDSAGRAFQLAEDEGIGLEALSFSDVRMGPQGQVSFMALLRECEAASNGRLFETRDPTAGDAYLTLLNANDMTNQAVALALDYNLGHITKPFEPTNDNTYLRNDWTVTRTGGAGSGSSVHMVANSGANTPARIGVRPDTANVNVEDDDQLPHQAGWRMNLSTVEGPRFSAVTLNLASNTDLIADWIGVDIGSRITIANPPPGIAPDLIDLLVEGYTETLGGPTWSVTLLCSPYQPHRVIELGDAGVDTNPNLGRYAGDEPCALRIAIDTDDLSMDVDPNRCRWTTDANSFPLNVTMKPAGAPGAGEVATVSGISTDVATFIAVGAASHADNAAVAPALYAGHATDQMIFLVGAIRSSGTGTLATPAGYTRLPVFDAADNVQVWVKRHTGSESNPTVTPSGGSAGDTVSAVTFGLGNLPITLDDLGGIVVDALAQLNASAANIAYPGLYSWRVPGCVQLIIGWKQDDYTSVALPAGSGFTEMIEAPSTTGSDQSLYIAYRIDTIPAVVNEGALAVTGGASAISRAATIAIAGGKQTFTLSARGVNGVAMSHPVGTRIAVEDPGVLAL